MSLVEVDELTRVYRSGKGLRKSGAEVTALDRVSLEVEPTEIHGLLGPNGAGKTTLVKVLSTVLLPTSGTARVCGYDVVVDTAEVRRRIGIVFGGERGLYLRLTARRNLLHWAAMYRLTNRQAAVVVDRLLERVGLSERAEERVETFSRGMKQRLHLARGLVGDPEVLFLDEPTTGMDPVAARDFRSLVAELRTEGKTILLTTHDMAEAESVCDRVSLIDRGVILATEAPRALSRWITTYDRVVVDGDCDVDALRLLDGVAEVTEADGTVVIDTAGGTAAVLRWLVDRGVTDVRVEQPSLEDVYVHVFGARGMDV